MKLAFEPKALYHLLFGMLISLAGFSQTTIVANNASWSYRDNNLRPVGWPTSYDVTGWSAGAAPLGYINPVTTTVSFGPDANNKYITTYFHKVISIPDAGIYGSYTLNLVRDDGVIIYVNGQEIVRSNMPKTAPAHGTFSVSSFEMSSRSCRLPMPTPCFQHLEINLKGVNVKKKVPRDPRHLFRSF